MTQELNPLKLLLDSERLLESVYHEKCGIMHTSMLFAEGAIREALRPRNSGRVVDAHVISMRREPTPDYDKMRRAVQGVEVEDRSAPQEGDSKDGN